MLSHLIHFMYVFLINIRYNYHYSLLLPSVLRQCLLDIRKDIEPAKISLKQCNMIQITFVWPHHSAVSGMLEKQLFEIAAVIKVGFLNVDDVFNGMAANWLD